MARAATTSDVFNALAETRRREILSFLADSEKPVGEIAVALSARQASVSKHLGVLSRVGLVRARRIGRHRMYRANAGGIRPLYDFAKAFEKYWIHQLLRVKARAEAKKKRTQEENYERDIKRNITRSRTRQTDTEYNKRDQDKGIA